MLRLITFGGFGIRADGPGSGPGQQLAVSRRALALLVLVAAAPRTGISRDKVLALLWAESDEERGRNALRQTLHTLRRELRTPGLFQGGEALRLDPGEIESDVRDFESARDEGRAEEAVRVYAGPFLDGFHVGGAPEFERWVEETRAAYRHDFRGVLEVLAREGERARDAASAVKWWRRLAAEDPLDSSVAVALMGALVTAGDRAGALRHGQVHETLVREELGVGPDPAVRDLLDRLRGATPPSSTALPPVARPADTRRPDREMPEVPAVLGSSFRDHLRQELEGRYVIEDEPERRQGAAVRLLRARDVRHERAVLLKVVHPALASMIDVGRFLREIKLTARLRHPSIVPLLDSGEVNGLPWFAMPEVGGVSLRARLTTGAPFPLQQALRLVEELAGALDYAHRHGVVHRDVCPENIQLVEGHALLVNLGLARALDLSPTPRLTETGALVGSPAYVSPEQAVGGPVDGRSDQFSLACVLYEMLTGEPLFSGPSPHAILAKRAAFRPSTLVSVDGVPGSVLTALRQALSADPGTRFPTIAEFASVLTASHGQSARVASGWFGWFRTR